MKLAERVLMGALAVFQCVAIAAVVLFIAAVIAIGFFWQHRENSSAGVPPVASQDDDYESGSASADEDEDEDEDAWPPSDSQDSLHYADIIPEPSFSADSSADAKSGVPLDPSSSPNPVQDMPDPGSGSVSPARPFALDEALQASIGAIAESHGAVGVQVAVINGGEVVGSCLYGYAKKDSAPMSADTKIRVASLSKVVLAMIVMQLSELGRLDIDADIGEYWGAEVRNPNHKDIPITMRQMLSHTSSIRVYDDGFGAGGRLIRDQFLNGSCFDKSVPGAIESWGYNNYAYAALGVTVEIATRETVNSLASQHMFAPLGIDASFGTGNISGTDKLATLYTAGGGVGRSVDAQKRTLGSAYPGERGYEFPGGLTISAYDYAKLIAALINDGEYGGVRILSPESVAQIEAPQGHVEGFDQCLALRRLKNHFGEDVLFYHTGSSYGVFCLMSYNPASGNGVVVLTSGADGKRDRIGIPMVCAKISEFIYEEMQR